MWYHISKEYIGKEVILTPQVPKSAGLIEGDIPRICVSSTIYKCLLAIQGCDSVLHGDEIKSCFSINPCVYITEEVPYIPPECADFRQNDERWFLNPTSFRYLANVDIFHLFSCNEIIATNDSLLRFPKGRKTAKNPKENFLNFFLKTH